MRFLFLTALIAFASCTDSTQSKTDKSKMTIDDEVVVLDFIDLIDSANVEGSILIAHKDTFYSNDFDWAEEQHIPASTFKIPNSIIALELGILSDDQSIIKWDGKQHFMDSWEQDLSFRDAFHLSCVPCYQEIARKVGVERMIEQTDALRFGKLHIDSSNIDQFWLTEDAQISQFEEIDFLKRFRNKELHISDRTHEIMSRMMIIEQNDQYTLRGKTGWSANEDENNCWFVGYVEFENEVYYFATNIEPDKDADISKIVSLRKEITIKALQLLGVPIEIDK